MVENGRPSICGCMLLGSWIKRFLPTFRYGIAYFSESMPISRVSALSLPSLTSVYQLRKQTVSLSLSKCSASDREIKLREGRLDSSKPCLLS